jgi:hypothetical protein
MDEPRPDDDQGVVEDPFETLEGDEGGEDPSQAASGLGALGQIAVGVLVVLTVVALFVGAAVAIRRVFH